MADRAADGDIVAMTIDRRRSQPWVATRRFLMVYRLDGTPSLAGDAAAVGEGLAQARTGLPLLQLRYAASEVDPATL